VVTDISFNGKYVHVGLIGNNGERAIGIYKRVGWDFPPATVWRRMSGLPPKAVSWPEPESLPPAPGETRPI
jgi:hypothetical protein